MVHIWASKTCVVHNYLFKLRLSTRGLPIIFCQGTCKHLNPLQQLAVQVLFNVHCSKDWIAMPLECSPVLYFNISNECMKQ